AASEQLVVKIRAQSPRATFVMKSKDAIAGLRFGNKPSLESAPPVRHHKSSSALAEESWPERNRSTRRRFPEIENRSGKARCQTAAGETRCHGEWHRFQTGFDPGTYQRTGGQLAVAGRARQSARQYRPSYSETDRDSRQHWLDFPRSFPRATQ